MTMDAERLKLYRQPCYLLKLHMDMCTKQNPAIGSGGGDECAATSACHYTWFTCKDTIHYTKGTRIFQFCNREANIPGCLPLLKKEVTHLPVKVNTDKFKTEVGELRLDFDDFPLSARDMADPDKVAGGYSTFETEGASFWVTWKARNKNYAMRKAEFYRGFVNLDPSDFELEFTGGIYDVALAPKGAKVTIRSFLWETANKKFPNKVSDFVVTTNHLYVGTTTLTVDNGSLAYDGTSLFDAATANQPRCLKIGDEYVTYTSISPPTITPPVIQGTQFNGLVRGAYGTTAAVHPVGTKISQVVIYAEDDAVSWEDCGRVLADHCLMDLLLFYAKIGIDYIKTYDHGITLTGDINETVTTIPIDSVADIPEFGIIRIDDEAIWYRGILGIDLINCRRGQYGTTPATHSTSASVLIFGVTEAIGHWHSGLSFKARFEDQDDIASRVETWRACAFANVWPDTDGKIDVSLQVPPIGESTKEYTDDDIIQGTKTWTGNDKTRKSRIQTWYKPRKPDPKISGEDQLEDDYYGLAGYRDAEGENTNVFGDVQLKTIYGEWLENVSDAAWLAEHIFTRLRRGINTLEASLELKDDDVELMDLVKLRVAEDADADGVLQSVYYIVVSKVKDGWSRIKLIFEQAGFVGDVRFAGIGPINPILTAGASTDVSTTPITIADVSGRRALIDEFKSDGTKRQILIGNEKISYTSAVVGPTAYAVTLSGITRGEDGTAGAGYVYGESVFQLYSSVADEHARRYGWIGDADNLLDGDGDFTEETDGYSIW